MVKVPLTLLCATPAAPPLNPVPLGAAQSKVVPAGTLPLVPFTGVAVNATPEQTFAVMAVIAGTGVRLTCTLNVEPVQALATGVTV